MRPDAVVLQPAVATEERDVPRLVRHALHLASDSNPTISPAVTPMLASCRTLATTPSTSRASSTTTGNGNGSASRSRRFGGSRASLSTVGHLALLVRTWNVFHGNALPPRRRGFLREMIELVCDDSPDVVCLQEVPVWGISRLEEWSSMQALAVVARAPRVPGRGGRARHPLESGLLPLRLRRPGERRFSSRSLPGGRGPGTPADQRFRTRTPRRAGRRGRRAAT